MEHLGRSNKHSSKRGKGRHTSFAATTLGHDSLVRPPTVGFDRCANTCFACDIFFDSSFCCCWAQDHTTESLPSNSNLHWTHQQYESTSQTQNMSLLSGTKTPLGSNHPHNNRPTSNSRTSTTSPIPAPQCSIRALLLVC